jgi:hypothetical protein
MIGSKREREKADKTPGHQGRIGDAPVGGRGIKGWRLWRKQIRAAAAGLLFCRDLLISRLGIVGHLSDLGVFVFCLAPDCPDVRRADTFIAGRPTEFSFSSIFVTSSEEGM